MKSDCEEASEEEDFALTSSGQRVEIIGLSKAKRWADPHWLNRLKRLDYDVEEAMQELKNDRLAIGMQAVLVMIVGISTTMVNPFYLNNSNLTLVCLTSLCYLLFCLSSLLSAFCSVIDYSSIKNRSGEDYFLVAQTLFPSNATIDAATYLYISIYTLVLGIGLSVISLVGSTLSVVVFALVFLNIFAAARHQLKRAMV